MSDHLVAFLEGDESFQRWSRESEIIGDVGGFDLKEIGAVSVTEAFHKLDEGVILPQRWGRFIQQQRDKSWNGLWLRLSSVPVLKPWRLPETWGELRAVLREQEIELDTALKRAVKKLRDGNPHFLLLGFPIPGRLVIHQFVCTGW